MKRWMLSVLFHLTFRLSLSYYDERTMALVGLGASAFTIASVHGFVPQTALGLPPGSPLLSGVKADLSRVAAGVVSGVGFIGAGAGTCCFPCFSQRYQAIS